MMKLSTKLLFISTPIWNHTVCQRKKSMIITTNSVSESVQTRECSLFKSNGSDRGSGISGPG